MKKHKKRLMYIAVPWASAESAINACEAFLDDETYYAYADKNITIGDDKDAAIVMIYGTDTEMLYILAELVNNGKPILEVIDG